MMVCICLHIGLVVKNEGKIKRGKEGRKEGKKEGKEREGGRKEGRKEEREERRRKGKKIQESKE